LGIKIKKILITGACGYIGARLSKYLAEKGYCVTVFDSFDPSHYIEWTSLMDEVIIGDIREETTISDLADKQFDVVIQLISLDHHKSESNPNFVSSINIMPTWNLLNSIIKKGLDQFIYFSTIHVYGNLPKNIISEDHNPAPINGYGLTHLLSENICNYFNENTETNCINVRLSNSYGSPVFRENNCWWLVINNLCRTAFQKNKIKLLSDGSPERDFIHISDVCRAIDLLINTDKNKMPSSPFHISSGDTLTIWELAQTVNKIYQDRFNHKLKIIVPENSNFVNPVHAEKHIVSNTKIKSLGFRLNTELKTGINEIFDYLEKTHKE